MTKKELQDLRLNIGMIMKIALNDIPPLINNFNGILDYTIKEQLEFLNMLEIRLTDYNKKCEEILLHLNFHKNTLKNKGENYE